MTDASIITEPTGQDEMCRSGPHLAGSAPGFCDGCRDWNLPACPPSGEYCDGCGTRWVCDAGAAQWS